MKRILCYIFTISLLISCGKSKEGNMTVNGTIDGLKKGTVYLQKMKDTLLISVDSIQLNGESNFTLVDKLKSPEIYFIQLDDSENNVISFFGEEGEITVTTKLSKFSTSAKITGSVNHELLEKHKEMISQFNGKQLDLIKEKFEAQRDNDSTSLLKIEKEEANLLKRKYYYSTNYAVTNATHEVAPYIALTDLYYANIKLLDTINNSLSKKVKKSKYGVELDEFIKEIKGSEK